MEFTFGIDIIERLVNEIKKAEEYFTIAIFQMHNGNIYNALEKALNRRGISNFRFSLCHITVLT